MDTETINRAEGCLLGQLVGDALGSQVEFMGRASIARRFPLGVRELRDGGTWNTLAGQPTDDSEMALLLARLLVKEGRYNAKKATDEYQYWLASRPFDVGLTIGSALRGHANTESQANGAMMRVSPLGIFCALRPLIDAAAMARADAAITHPNRICLETNALYVMAIAEAVRTESTPQALYQKVTAWSVEMGCHGDVRDWIDRAAIEPPPSFEQNAGWVKIAFWNALHKLLHAGTFEDALVETVGAGGDTDTNAAIVGSLLGAVYGRRALPKQWVDSVLNCRPEAGRAGVRRPRPIVFWPTDALELGRALLDGEKLPEAPQHKPQS